MDSRKVKAARLSAAFVCGLLLALAAASYVSAANEVNHVRGDFCAYLAEVYQVTRELPQVPARIQAERNDTNLSRQLGC